MKRSKSQIERVVKLRQVTKLPNWYLCVKGKKDSQQGKGMCDEYLDELVKSEQCLETKVVQATENTLAEIRKLADEALFELKQSKKILDMNHKEAEEVSALEIQIMRRRKQSEERYQKALNNLGRLKEIKDSMHATMMEQVELVRNFTLKKIKAYSKGIKKGALNEYSYKIVQTEDFLSQSINKYMKIHEKLDETLDYIVENEIYQISRKDYSKERGEE